MNQLPNRIDWLLSLLKKTRGYTNSVLDRIPESDWFRQPQEGVTHVAWQVGHLAVAEYFLALNLVRGKRPEDSDLIPERIISAFGRTSVPDPVPSNNPSPGELRQFFDDVHQQTILELSEFEDSVLDEKLDVGHPMFHDKFGSLVWCSQHEFSHSGQLSLVRRLLGGEFTW